MPFDYYESLSAKNKRIYRASDAVVELALPEPALEGLRVKVRRLRGALAGASQRNTESAARELARAVSEGLGVPAPSVRVHEVRPSGAYGELHGLYTRWPDGRARIEVWMRTAVNEQTVAFRTFLRTLAHELVHHLDYVHLALEDSFHTEGFFRRESSLVKQLDAPPQESARRRRLREEPAPDETRAQKMERLRERLVRPRKGTGAMSAPSQEPASVSGSVSGSGSASDSGSGSASVSASVSGSGSGSVSGSASGSASASGPRRQLAFGFED